MSLDAVTAGAAWTAASGPPTPVVAVPFDGLTVLLKLEYLQTGASVKARIAGGLVDALEVAGELDPATCHVVEVTAGNTALALHHELRRRDHAARVVAVMSEKMSQAKVDVLERLGVDVRRVPNDVAHVTRAEDAPLFRAAAEIQSRLPAAVSAGQFFRQANVEAHRFGTGAEVVAQLTEPPDAFVAGAGTGGTLTGMALAFRDAGWSTRVVLADPAGSVIAPLLRGEPATAEPTVVEGIGGDFVPPLLRPDLVDAAVTVGDRAVLDAWHRLASLGLVVGSSTACAVAAAASWDAAQGPAGRPRRCLVLAADSGMQYDRIRRLLSGRLADVHAVPS
jgi:cystathionine beta-synthase